MGREARANPTAQAKVKGELLPRVKEPSEAAKNDARRAIRLALGGLLSLRDREKVRKAREDAAA